MYLSTYITSEVIANLDKYELNHWLGGPKVKIFGSQSADHWLKCVGSHKITCISGDVLH